MYFFRSPLVSLYSMDCVYDVVGSAHVYMVQISMHSYIQVNYIDEIFSFFALKSPCEIFVSLFAHLTRYKQREKSISYVNCFYLCSMFYLHILSALFVNAMVLSFGFCGIFGTKMNWITFSANKQSIFGFWYPVQSNTDLNLDTIG